MREGGREGGGGNKGVREMERRREGPRREGIEGKRREKGREREYEKRLDIKSIAWVFDDTANKSQ